MPPSYDEIVTFLIIVTTILTPMAFVEIGIVFWMGSAPLSGWIFVFGGARFSGAGLYLRLVELRSSFLPLIALAHIWIAVALLLAILHNFRERVGFRISALVISLALILQIAAPLLLLANSIGGLGEVEFVIPLPIPSVFALIVLLDSRRGLLSTKVRSLVEWKPLTRESMRKRTPVLILLIYYIWIIVSAFSMRDWWWSTDSGVTWERRNPGLFVPFPLPPGDTWGLSFAYPTDQLFYLVFMFRGAWLLWIAVGLLYIFSPYRLNQLYLSKVRNPISKATEFLGSDKPHSQ
ncbi:MAG: hypothetical protein ACFFER_13535 [Candidatus Thorarchaeota archaeon]